MTPAQMLDFSNGGSVQFAVSTSKTDDRDWIDLWISPFDEQLLLPSGGIPPDLQGPTKDALNVVINASIPTTVNVQEYHNFVESAFDGTGQSIEACEASLGGVSATRRDPILLNMTRTHVRVDLLVNGTPCTLFNRDINDLGFTLGVVQVGHHSYAPDEASACNIPGCTVNRGTGAGNTYHWSSFSMSPAVPFTMLRGDMSLTGIQAGTTHTVNFAAPAPPNSFLRFSALAKRGSVTVSSNGGAPVVAREQVQHGDGSDGINDSSHIGSGQFRVLRLGNSGRQYLEPDSARGRRPRAFRITFCIAYCTTFSVALPKCNADAYAETPRSDHQRSLHGHHRRRSADWHL
jgi:hypothetical protein